MTKLELEVIHFDNRDIITSSGNHLGNPLEYGSTQYGTLNRELKQSGVYLTVQGVELEDSHEIKFYWQTGDHFDSYTSAGNVWESCTYAWYNKSNNTWGTDGQLVKQYLDNNISFPTGTD